VDEVVNAILTLGEGAFSLQVDGVKTGNGDCYPVLISFIEANFQRNLHVLGVGYDTGKSASANAANICEQIKQLNLLDVIDEVLENRLSRSKVFSQAIPRTDLQVPESGGRCACCCLSMLYVRFCHN